MSTLAACSQLDICQHLKVLTRSRFYQPRLIPLSDQMIQLVPSILIIFNSQKGVIHACFGPVGRISTLCWACFLFHSWPTQLHLTLSECQRVCVTPQTAGRSGSRLDLRRSRLASAPSILSQKPAWLRLCRVVRWCFPLCFVHLRSVIFRLLLYSCCLVFLSWNLNKNFSVKGINKGCWGRKNSFCLTSLVTPQG